MESIFPMVPLARRQALCVGIMSYDGQVNFGLIGDYDAMADLESFALDLEAATAEVIATAPARSPKRGQGARPRGLAGAARQRRRSRPGALRSLAHDRPLITNGGRRSGSASRGGGRCSRGPGRRR